MVFVETFNLNHSSCMVFAEQTGDISHYSNRCWFTTVRSFNPNYSSKCETLFRKRALNMIIWANRVRGADDVTSFFEKLTFRSDNLSQIRMTKSLNWSEKNMLLSVNTVQVNWQPDPRTGFRSKPSSSQWQSPNVWLLSSIKRHHDKSGK